MHVHRRAVGIRDAGRGGGGELPAATGGVSSGALGGNASFEERPGSSIAWQRPQRERYGAAVPLTSARAAQRRPQVCARAAQEYMENVLQLPMNRRDGIGKLAAVLKLRAQVRHWHLCTPVVHHAGGLAAGGLKTWLPASLHTTCSAGAADVGPRHWAQRHEEPQALRQGDDCDGRCAGCTSVWCYGGPVHVQILGGTH